MDLASHPFLSLITPSRISWSLFFTYCFQHCYSGVCTYLSPIVCFIDTTRKPPIYHSLYLASQQPFYYEPCLHFLLSIYISVLPVHCLAIAILPVYHFLFPFSSHPPIFDRYSLWTHASRLFTLSCTIYHPRLAGFRSYPL